MVSVHVVPVPFHYQCLYSRWRRYSGHRLEAQPQTNPDCTTATIVFAIQLLAIGGCFKTYIPLSGQRNVVDCFEATTLNMDISVYPRSTVTDGDNAEIVAAGQATALANRLFLGLF